MNNKITLYELLGKIKDGQAPKRFIKDNVLWYKGKSDTDHYYCENGKWQLICIKLSELNDEIELIDNEVEILDSEDEDIEDIDFKTAGTQKEKNRIMKDKINELVREVNSMKRKIK